MAGEKFTTEYLMSNEYLLEVSSRKNERMKSREIYCIGYRISNHVNGFCKAKYLDGWYSQKHLSVFKGEVR